MSWVSIHAWIEDRCAQLSARQAHMLVLNHDPARGYYCVTVGPGWGVRGGWRQLRFAQGESRAPASGAHTLAVFDEMLAQKPGRDPALEAWDRFQSGVR